MTIPEWYSQPFPPEGASAAEGIRNQLGRPSLDPLTILVRESAQNSWDARISDDVPVDYRVDLRAVGPAHANAWRDLVQAGAPNDSRLPLRKSLRQPQIRIMSISDRGTRGLGGPTRADSAVDERHDFVSFVRNVGEPRDNALGGGTYGFGKGIFYLVSGAGTVLLHTRCQAERGGYETRLIACALWESYLEEEDGHERRYTGRHWWGDTSGDVIEPLVGADAEEVARRLGLDAFGPGETGTTIVVIDPRFDDLDSDAGRAPREIAEHLAETISWQLWPKMLGAQDGQPAMRFGVWCDGVDIEVPDPRTTRPLNMFVTAYEQMAGPQGEELTCGRPKRALGRLGLVKRHLPPLEETTASLAAGIEKQAHHVCLMRSAELVVTYHACPKPPSEFLSYAGVFRANSELDDTYARAEPPTHDAWNHHFLEQSDSTFVRTTFTRIKESVNKLLELTGTAGRGSAKMALGAASSMLSPLVGGSWGLGGATAYRPPGSTKSPRPNTEAEAELAQEEVDESVARIGSPRAGGAVSGESGGAAVAGPHSGAVGTDAMGGDAPGAESNPVRRRPRLVYLGEPFYDEHEGAAVLVQEFRLPVPGPQEVRVELGVTIAGGEGRETEPPVGAAMPELVGWGDDDGVASAEPVFPTEGDPERRLRVLIRPAPDTMTDIELRVKAVRAP